MLNSIRQPSEEWQESSCWEDVVKINGNYTLGVGYCYTLQLKEFFKKQNIDYHFFQTKWGTCGTTFLFSALRPNNIIMPISWANSITIARSTEPFFTIWAEILKNILSINVKTMIIDFPAAWHKSNLFYDFGCDMKKTQQEIDYKRKIYYNNIINPYISKTNNVLYLDLYNHIPYDSPLIYENIQQDMTKTPSPWHTTQKFIDHIGLFFLDFIKNDAYNTNELIEELNS